MKKLLALVLALVMTLSLAVVGSNAAFKDADKVNETYAEAVDVLAGMKVFQGYTDGSFQPEGSITRAEVAAIVYRLYTGDVTDKQASLYATYNKFSDMTGAAWAAGYIGYCANAGLIKGYDAKTFGPADKVTGYQALAMILRAVGYDKNGEFVGADWQLHVAQTAQQLGILKNVKGVDLNAAASRELVAELLFRTAAYVPMVNYTPALGYTNLTAILNGKTNLTLGEKNFNLTKTSNNTDEFGRPFYTWTNGKTVVYATIKATPVATFQAATTECDIASAYGLKGNKTFVTYTNGAVNKGQYLIEAKDTVQKLGAQGTLIEVYDNDSIVMIDTFLANVTDVKEATFDTAGHLKTDSRITLNVYNNGYVQGDATKAGQTLVLTNEDVNYNYAKGDMVLVSAVMDNVSGLAKLAAGSNVTPVYAEIQGVAKTIEGAQSFLWYNAKQHTVEGTNYNDAKWFRLDQAGKSTAKYTWYFDNYGNLIGDTLIATAYTYAVIENIQWQNPALAVGYAQATLRYMDGTSETKVVTDIDKTPLAYAFNNIGVYPASVSTVLQNNKPFVGEHLYRVATAADGTVSLKHVFVGAVNSELTKATIKTGIAAIQGMENNSLKAIYVNSNTTFLVRTGTFETGFTYTVVKGYENIGNYSGTATVDYVNLDGDLYADYVYVTGTADASTGKQMFYLTSSNVQAVLKSDNIKYYVLTGIVDGVPGTIEVKYNTAAGTATALNDSNVEQWAKQNVNRMFTVNYKDGQIVNIWGPKSDIADLYTEIGTLAYNNLALAYFPNTNGTTALWDGEVLALGANKYNVVGLTPVYGEFKADMSNKAVYVVYDKSVTVAGAYGAKAVYIVDLAEQGSDGSQSAPAYVNGIQLNDQRTVVLDVKNSVKDSTYVVTLSRLDNNGYVVVGNFTATVPSNGAAATVDLSAQITNGTYKVTFDTFEAIRAF